MRKSILLAGLLTLASAGFAQNKLTPELLWKLGRVGDAVLSPDGKTVAYTVRNFNLSENKGNTDMYTIAVTGGEPKLIAGSSDNESSPAWSADSKKIYFLNDKGGANNLWCMNSDGSGAKQITSTTDDISCFGISKAGNRIWMAKEVKVDKTTQDLYPDLPKATGKIYDDLMYRHWTEWEDGSYSHVFIADFKNDAVGELKDIQKGERFDTPMKPNGGGEQIAWSPDGNKIAYTCKKLAGKDYAVSTNSDIYLYDVASGKTENISASNEGYDMSPAFSPEGSRMMWLSMQTPTYEADRNRIMIYDFATKKNYGGHCRI